MWASVASLHPTGKEAGWFPEPVHKHHFVDLIDEHVWCWWIASPILIPDTDTTMCKVMALLPHSLGRYHICTTYGHNPSVNIHGFCVLCPKHLDNSSHLFPCPLIQQDHHFSTDTASPALVKMPEALQWDHISTQDKVTASYDFFTGIKEGSLFSDLPSYVTMWSTFHKWKIHTDTQVCDFSIICLLYTYHANT